MIRSSLALLLLSLTLLILPESSLANKFTTIGGGLSGASNEKIEILKQLAAFTGLFFITLGLSALLTKKRFEGFIGMRKKNEGDSPAPYALILLGGLLSVLFFI